MLEAYRFMCYTHTVICYGFAQRLCRRRAVWRAVALPCDVLAPCREGTQNNWWLADVTSGNACHGIPWWWFLAIVQQTKQTKKTFFSHGIGGWTQKIIITTVSLNYDVNVVISSLSAMSHFSWFSMLCYDTAFVDFTICYSCLHVRCAVYSVSVRFSLRRVTVLDCCAHATSRSSLFFTKNTK